VLGVADEALLRRAGRHGMSSDSIAAKSGDLVEIALRGCRRLGTSIVSEEAMAQLATHFLIESDQRRPRHQAH
jgi:hypothetical protein